MSMIIPAGGPSFNWGPNKEETPEEMVKTASTGEETQEVKSAYEESKDALYEAAQKVVADAEEAEVKQAQFETEEVCEDDNGECAEVVDGAEENDSVEFETEVVEEVSEETTAEEAVEKLEDAVDAVKEVVGVEGDSDEGEVSEEVSEEIEIELPEEPVQEEIEIVLEGQEEAATEHACESCGALASTEDETVEASTEEKVVTACDCDPCKCDDDCECDPCDDDDCCLKASKSEAKTVEASTSDEFVKLAKISPSNRKKLVNYWTKSLGYPKDYVSLLVKDYE